MVRSRSPEMTAVNSDYCGLSIYLTVSGPEIAQPQVTGDNPDKDYTHVPKGTVARSNFPCF